MKVTFHRADDEEQLTVASAEWDGHDVTIVAEDDALRATLARAYRRTPVSTDDSSFRRLGTHGPAVIPPGDLEWFRAATTLRAAPESLLVARFIADAAAGGYDPAAGYRRFEDQVERLDARSRG
jgi:hypothetical protein